MAAASSLDRPSQDAGYPDISEIVIPAGVACTPVLSPTGRDVAYVHWDADGSTHINLQRLGSSQAIRRTDFSGRDYAPAWSADGQWLAFMRLDPENGTCRLMKMPSLTGEAQVLASCPRHYSIYQMNWSRDGRFLVLAGRQEEDAPSRILRFSLESRRMAPITDPPQSSQGDSYPEYSPEGRHLAFVRSFGPQRHQLMIRDLETGLERKLGSEETTIFNLAWTSDSRNIVYAGYRSATYQLYKISRQGGKAAWLPTQGMRVSMPDISLESNRLVYLTFDFKAGIWSFGLAPSGRELESAEAIFQSTSMDYAPALSPDGSQMAFISQRAGRAQVWIAGPDGSGRRPVAGCTGALIRSVAWSPEGSRIVFPCPAGEAELPALNVLGLEDGKRQLFYLEQTANDVVWPRGGDALIFTSRGRTRSQIYRLSPGDTRPQPLTREGGRQLRLTADGKSVYYRGADSNDVYLLGDASRPVGRLPESAGNAWGVGPDAIFARGPGEAFLRIDLKSGETAEIPPPVEPWPQLRRSGLSISRDGQILAVEQVGSDAQLMYLDLTSR